MSTATTPPPAEEPKFDYRKFAEQRNAAEGKPTPRVEPKPEEAKTTEPAASAPAAEAPKEPEAPHVSRSQRRELNRLREQAARSEGEAAALRLMLQNGQFKPQEEKVDPLDRKNFATEAEYIKAVAKTAATEATKEKEGANEFTNQFAEEAKNADAAYLEQSKLIPGFDKIFEEAQDLEFKDKPGFMTLFVLSDMRAHLAEHFVKNPGDFEKAIDLETNPIGQARFIARLEAKLETVYDQRKKAAQATKTEPAKETESKDRTHPAEAQAGRTAGSGGNQAASLPKPSSEVSARGGSAPPISEPKPGSAEWMRRRNEQLANRNY